VVVVVAVGEEQIEVGRKENEDIERNEV